MSFDPEEYDHIVDATNELCRKVENISPYLQGKIVQGAMLILEHARLMVDEYGSCDARFTTTLEMKGFKVTLTLKANDDFSVKMTVT